MSTLTAEPALQRRLLELQELDSKIARAKAALARLRSDRDYAEAQEELTRQRAALGEAQQGRSLADRAAREAEDRSASTRAHRDRTHNRLHDGHGSHKDLEAMMHEEQTLEGLLTEHEKDAADARERAAEAAADVERVQADLAAAEGAVSARADQLRREGAEITAEGKALTVQRAQLAAAFPAPLLARYDKIRVRNGGVGAAELTGSGSSASSTPLSPVELERLRALPADVVAECPETGALLVRS